MQRMFVVPVICLSVLFAGVASAGEAFPSRPLRIVTTDVGNNNDLLSRLLAEALSRSLSQQVIVENRGGAGGAIPVEKLMGAMPDGHTIMVHGTSIWLLPLLRDDTPWDPFRDFAPISLISRSPAVMVVPASLPPKTVTELIDYAKARPGQLNYSSVDDGSPSHLAAALFTSMARINVVRVTYKGGAAAFSSLLAGEGHLMVNAIAPALVHVRAGRMRALAVTAPSKMLPELPTVATTLPGYEWITHQAIFAPAKTPPAIVNRLSAEAVRALDSAELRERGMKLGVELASSSPAAVTAMMKSETTRMRPVIQGSALGAK
jgi:tripartite-type tricarboxylate transporter receptor subunit TctC